MTMKRILSSVLVLVLLLSLVGCGSDSGSDKCTSIKLSENQVSLAQPGQTRGLAVTKTPADATDSVRFESSDSSVAIVDEYGLITAVGAGIATITVTCGDAVAFCEVTVGNDDPHPPEPVEVDCSDCGGDGKQRCNYCKGDYQCQKCEGSGFVDVDWGSEEKCYSCGGGPEGNGDCKYCGGDGCTICDYSGICNACNTNGKDYKYQFGDWAATCKACDGSGVFCKWCEEGFLDCQTCDGKGRITTTSKNTE